MNFKQYLYIKLAEEMNEIAQMALKCALFGEEGTDPREVDGLRNVDKLNMEIDDKTAVMELLNETYDEGDEVEEDREYIEAKKKSLLKHFAISQQRQQEGKL